MFGYVKPVVAELLVKEHEFYKATYCGVCRALKAECGTFSNVLHSYDSVFLALVRMLFIPDGELGTTPRRCIAHPGRKKPMLNANSAITYTAKAFGILTYYKIADDVRDEGVGRKMLSALVRPIYSGACKKASLAEVADTVKDRLEKITALEAAGCKSVDEPAGLFGELLGRIFSEGLSGSDAKICYEVGYHLGKFIYEADAAEDYERDRARGSYNPFVLLYGGESLTDENRNTIKRALLYECSQIELAVNLLPFGKKYTIENIIKNVIYLGLPKRIEFLDKQSTEAKEENK